MAALTKTCPQCAEQVKAVARVCRFCGYRWAPPPAVGVSAADEPEGSAGEAAAVSRSADEPLAPAQPEEQSFAAGPSSAAGPECFCGCGRLVELWRRNANDWGATVRAELDDWAGRDLAGWSNASDFVQTGREISEQLKRSVHGDPVDRPYGRRDVAYWVTTSRLALTEGLAADRYLPLDSRAEATSSPPTRPARGAARSFGRLLMRFSVFVFVLGLIGLTIALGNELFQLGLGLFQDGYVLAAGLMAAAAGVVGAILFLTLDDR